jgi:endoglucanase
MVHGVTRRALLLVVACAAVSAGCATTADAARVKPPLHTSGAKIVDRDGKTVVLQGVNWFGFETSAHVVHGLWSRDLDDVMSQIRRMGFNTIRLPFSLQALASQEPVANVGQNAELQGKTPQQAMDVVIDAAARAGLMILLENHSLADDGYSYGLWYGQAGFEEDDWVAAWQALARRYKDRRNVIGADLKNEPHGDATWGTGGPTDWRRAAQRAGNAVTAIAPDWLIVVEGIEKRVAGGKLDTHWWGGNLEGVRRAPVRLSRPNRLVYSPHEYGPGVFPQPWFGRPDTAGILARRWRDGWGYIASEGIAPLLIGEFGGRRVDLQSSEGRWQRQFLDYLARTGISWTYWALNPNSGDTGGILRDDWTSVDRAKLELLQRTIRRQRIAYVASALTPRSPSVSVQKNLGMSQHKVEPESRLSEAATGGLQARVVVESRWDAGWCGRFEITGADGADLSGRSIAFTLPAGTRITQSWNGEFSGTEGRVRVGLPAWARSPMTSTGFCVAGTGAASGVKIL